VVDSLAAEVDSQAEECQWNSQTEEFRVGEDILVVVNFVGRDSLA